MSTVKTADDDENLWRNHKGMMKEKEVQKTLFSEMNKVKGLPEIREELLKNPLFLEIRERIKQATT